MAKKKSSDKKTDSSLKSVTSKIVLDESRDFTTHYANLAFFAEANHDVSMMFCRVDPPSPLDKESKARATKLVRVLVAKSHARSILTALRSLLGDEKEA